MGSLTLSSVGIGTYLGPADAATDDGYRAAVLRALALGLNVIDTASNYRHQRSERAVGRALADAVEQGLVGRDQILVASKAGFLAFDGARPADPRAAIERQLVARGVLSWDDVVAGCHSLAPGYLRHTIEQSRANLGLDTVDLYYLHNPETQLDEVERPVFLDRMRRAFEVLEQAVADGAIGCYGTATWNGYRVPPEDPGHLSLAALVGLAREVAGDRHHFCAVQLPFSRALPEAAVRPTQELDGARVTALEAARALGLYPMSSASIAQGQLAAANAADAGPAGDGRSGLATPAQRAIQAARSAPGMGTALVGMKNPAHVDQNAAVMTVAPAAA